MRYIDNMNLHKHHMIFDLNLSLLANIMNTHHICKTSPQEPDFIANLVLDWTNDFINILNSYLGKTTNFSAASIFCHQKPIAKYQSRKNPELGDLLIVFCHTDSNNNKILNSILLQAKVSDRSKVKVPLADRHQLYLYTNWPKFSYARANHLNGTFRDIYPKTINSGAQYLLIPKTYPSSYSHIPKCAMPYSTLISSNNFGEQLFKFLQFQTGRPFDDKHQACDDWSKMIWDLIDLAKSSTFNRKNAQFVKQSRIKQTTTNCYLSNLSTTSYFQDLLSAGGNNGNRHEEFISDDEDSSGISLIFIEAQDTDLIKSETVDQ